MAPKYVSDEELAKAVELIASAYNKKKEELLSTPSAAQITCVPRILVSLSGRPGSGKSTAATELARAVRVRMNESKSNDHNDNNTQSTNSCLSDCSALQNGNSAVNTNTVTVSPIVKVFVMPMDGYHLYRRELGKMADAPEAFRRRGAEWTFNPTKMANDLEQIRTPVAGSVGSYRAVYVPDFDHGFGDPQELALVIPSDANIILVEGNYLLYRGTPEWARVASMFDVKLFLFCAPSVCMERLCQRHMKAWSVSREEAMARVGGSDTLNGDLVDSTSGTADLILHSVTVDQSSVAAETESPSASQPRHSAWVRSSL